MNKVTDRVVGKGAFITDSRTHVNAMPQGLTWKDCVTCGRSTLVAPFCWKCRDKES